MSERRPFLDLRHTGTTSARAVVFQEYFHYANRVDPDPTAYTVPFSYRLDGPLDRAALAASIELVSRRHSIYRTAFREIDGELHQFVVPEHQVVPFKLEISDRSHVGDGPLETEWMTAVRELQAKGFDLDRGQCFNARLVVLAPQRHILVIVLHHIVWDIHTLRKLPLEIFDLYGRIMNHLPIEEPPLHHIDYVHALDEWTASPIGVEQREYWRSQLRDTCAVKLPFDAPSDEVTARRDAAPYGILAEPMHHPVLVVEVRADLKAAVIRTADEAGTTPDVVYLAALGWTLHHVTGRQEDICVETTFTPWVEYSDLEAHKLLEQMQGPIETWSMTRFDLSGQPTFGDVLRRTKQTVADGRDNGIIFDYYKLIPPRSRTVSFQNHGSTVPPLAFGKEVAPGLWGHGIRPPLPAWKRPWDLHLSLLNFPKQTSLMWAGSERLFRRETIVGLSERYLALLEAACGS